MPVISGADLTTVETSYVPLNNGVYRMRIKDAEVETEPKLRVIVKLKVVDSPDGERIGSEMSDYIYLTQKDGKPNEIGKKQLKRYFEAALGKEAANTAEPNTDDLKDQEVMVELEQESYKKPETEEQKAKGEVNETRINNKVKRVTPV